MVVCPPPPSLALKKLVLLRACPRGGVLPYHPGGNGTRHVCVCVCVFFFLSPGGLVKIKLSSRHFHVPISRRGSI